MLQKILLFWQLVWAFYIIILIVQQNYFSDLYPAEALDLSAKLLSVYNQIFIECTNFPRVQFFQMYLFFVLGFSD